MLRVLFAFALLLLSMAPGHAQSLAPADEAAVKEAITGQLQAFATDNDAGAYAYAAPLVKGIFPDTDTFMAMVKKGYQPVYRSKSHSFGEAFVDNLGRPAQRVIINAADGKRYEAVYTMERQPDGTWKIAGCYLIEVPSVDA